MEFLANTHGAKNTPQTVDGLSITHLEGPSEVQLNSW